MKPTPDDVTTYSFYHPSGLREYITAGELATKYDLELSDVVRLVSDRLRSVKGWTTVPPYLTI